ncbi:MAG: TonB-dependent receptor [Saprospiraceae bacterium]
MELYGSQGCIMGIDRLCQLALLTRLPWEKGHDDQFWLRRIILNDRISIIADIYSRDIKDKLANLTLPRSTGFSSILTNNGTIRNKGIELQVDGEVFRSNDFSWKWSDFYKCNRNYVIKLPENDNDLNRQGGTRIWNPDTGREEWVGGLVKVREWVTTLL